ncbi:hypothetical protein [Actinoplanes sp. NPDC051859]|uniref:hypothetical protein n=1 Tax=Actinoplanes sp. NPDC051859 TaxID=3363909 RepID=UPI0037B1B736
MLTVVAEIAHIRSGSPKGPRYDPSYPSSLVDEEENLLLLCGVHHKPVDDHVSAYSVDELLIWKRRQIAGPRRQLTANQVASIRTHYDLNALGHENFEKLCQAIAVLVMGRATELGLPGRLAWDAAFRGRLESYPTRDNPWQGHVAMQAIFKPATIVGESAGKWLHRQIVRELERVESYSRRKAGRPDYLIIASNVSLPSAPNANGIDSIYAFLHAEGKRIGIQDFAIWGEPELSRFLDAYPDVRYAFANVMTSRVSMQQLLQSLQD